ncbi:hypothetical protein [Alienimonas sp. DA493]|uniref:hypothetical protein n=1 Tax=Alienimonas sp. DA493 TaxID=3373605 RepID=UPI003754A95F
MSVAATVLPRKVAEQDSENATVTTAVPHPFVQRAARWHAEQRAWDEADAAWGRVVPQSYDKSPLNGTTEFWTASELCRVLGVPRVLLDALIPADRQNGEPVYDPSLIAAGLTEARRLRAIPR